MFTFFDSQRTEMLAPRIRDGIQGVAADSVR
jgi:hypothetical protein